jgi:hypothetical protein
MWETKLASDRDIEAWENPSIPSGYAYLLQLIGHDIIDSVPFIALDNSLRPAFRNARLQALVLDTIYGAGPDQAAHAYEIGERHRDSSGYIPRSRLRLGSLRGGERPQSASHCPHRDIARLTRWGERSTRDYPDWPAEPMIADQRNDDHALISQLTVLFHKLHNAILDLIEQRHAQALAASQSLARRSEVEIAYRRFICARLVVTMIYRNIIDKDVLRRILHPDVYQAYSSNPKLRLDDSRSPSLEFSHGALCLVHAMSRNHYRVNSEVSLPMEEALSQTSRRKPALCPRTNPNVPVSSKWSVDWGRFFGDGPLVNLSCRLGPGYASALTDPPCWDDKPLQYDFRGLAEHDLLAASLSGLWSVPALTRELRERLGDDALADLLPKYEVWHRPLHDWLNDATLGPLALTDADAAALVEDPPLPFFVLFEAAYAAPAGGLAEATSRKGATSFRGHGGQHLGPLGSIIVAETVYGALRSEPFGIDETALSFKRRIERCCSMLEVPKLLSDLMPEEIDTMPKLLHFMSGLDGMFLR